MAKQTSDTLTRKHTAGQKFLLMSKTWQRGQGTKMTMPIKRWMGKLSFSHYV